MDIFCQVLVSPNGDTGAQVMDQRMVDIQQTLDVIIEDSEWIKRWTFFNAIKWWVNGENPLVKLMTNTLYHLINGI